jgi:hypothetical protein
VRLSEVFTIDTFQLWAWLNSKIFKKKVARKLLIVFWQQRKRRLISDVQLSFWVFLSVFGVDLKAFKRSNSFKLKINRFVVNVNKLMKRFQFFLKLQQTVNVNFKKWAFVSFPEASISFSWAFRDFYTFCIFFVIDAFMSFYKASIIY